MNVVARVSGCLALSAWAGGFTGLAKTAALEWPKARVKAIDIEVGDRTPREAAEAIVEELLKGGPETEVGLTTANHRLVLEATQAETSGPAIKVDETSVIVATGGARGVTAVSLINLAKTTKAKIVLLGRTVLDKEPSFCKDANDQTALRRAFLTEAQSRGLKLDPAKVPLRGCTHDRARCRRRANEGRPAAFPSPARAPRKTSRLSRAAARLRR